MPKKEFTMRISAGLFWILAVTALLDTVAANPWAQDQAVLNPECEARFHWMDNNQDGRLSLEEFVLGSGAQTYGARKVLKHSFLAMDTSGKDYLTLEEFCKPVEPSGKTPEEECAEEFQKMDTDQDGKLTLYEYYIGNNARDIGARNVARNAFATMDRNGDEVLTEEEFCVGRGPLSNPE
jgi:Ca2+-binding EF-hand superfamily protein